MNNVNARGALDSHAFDNTLGVMNVFIHNQPPRGDEHDHRLRAVLAAHNTDTLADSFRTRFGIERVLGVYGMTEVNIPL